MTCSMVPIAALGAEWLTERTSVRVRTEGEMASRQQVSVPRAYVGEGEGGRRGDIKAAGLCPVSEKHEYHGPSRHC